MEKILLLVFGTTPAPNALDFACYLSGMTRSRLTGFFFENYKYEEQPALKKPFGLTYVETIVAGDLPENVVQRKKTEENIRVFRETCEEKGIPATAHRIQGSLMEDIIAESRFADLIIVDAAASYAGKEEEPPTSFVKELLATAQCPVMIAPVRHQPVDEIVFCYDGSPSSLFAMKQFTYLLPELDAARATVVQVKKEEDLPAAEKKRIMGWLSRHYNYADFTVLKGEMEDELFTYLLKKNNALVVMGAYGRNILSRFFRHSHADLLIKTLAYPVFITHY